MDNAAAINSLKKIIQIFEGMEVDFKELLRNPKDARDLAETHAGWTTIFGTKALMGAGDWGTFLAASRGFSSIHMTTLQASMNLLLGKRETDIKIVMKKIQAALDSGRKVLADLQKGKKAA